MILQTLTSSSHRPVQLTLRATPHLHCQSHTGTVDATPLTTILSAPHLYSSVCSLPHTCDELLNPVQFTCTSTNGVHGVHGRYKVYLKLRLHVAIFVSRFTFKPRLGMRIGAFTREALSWFDCIHRVNAKWFEI